jgi:TATA-binding protein-associated factor
LSSFTEAKVPKASIPAIKHFSIGTAQHALSVQFDALLKLVPKAGIKAVAGIQDRKSRLYASIGYYTVTKERLDAQVGAAVASALLAIQTVPDKHGPLVRAIMNAIKVCRKQDTLTVDGRIRGLTKTRCSGGV